MVRASASVAIGAEIVSALPAAAQNQNYYPPGNVLNFGADPTGQQDSAAAIQAAINYASSTSIGGVYVPGGVYLVDQPLCLPTQIKLHGDGIRSVIKCNFGSRTKIPDVSDVAGGVALAYPPMIYNAVPISYWSIQDIQFYGNNLNAYGAWFAQAYYGNLRNVYFQFTGQRPYTAIGSTFTNLSQVSFYGCGDGVICFDCQGFALDTVSFERNAGRYSFQWRVSQVGYGPLDMRNIWLENSSSNYNSIGYIGLGGYNIFGRSFLAANASSNAALQLIHIFDDNDALTVDGLSMPSITAHGIDIGQLSDLPNLHYYIGKNATGNAISGSIHLSNVSNNSGKTVNVNIGSSTNGTLATTLPNTVTSLQ